MTAPTLIHLGYTTNVFGTHVNVLSGLLYTNVTVPQGSTISSSSIQFTSASIQNGSPSFNITAQLSVNATVMTGSSYNLTSRTTTPASVTWSINNNWGFNEAASNELTPNLSSLIQTIVSQSGWVSGNNVLLFFKYALGSNTNFRTASLTPASLSITYTAPTTTTSTTRPTTTTTTTTHIVNCPGTTITTSSDLAPYISGYCQIITGPLVLSALDSSVTEASLITSFSHVTSITGGLSVTGTSSLATLDCFSSLSSSPVVYIVDNSGLVDARLPLLNRSASVVVTNNNRLCPLNYPLATGSCGVIDVTTTIYLTALNFTNFTLAEQQRMVSTLQAALSNITTVSCIAFYLFSLLTTKPYSLPSPVYLSLQIQA